MSANKSFSTETSERYSRALFEVAKESSELDKVENDVKSLLSLYNSSRDIQNFLKNPTKSINLQNQALYIISEKLGFSKNLKNFFLLLIKKRRIFFIEKISENFLKICSKHRGEVKSHLISSKELSQSEINEISKELSKSVGSTLKFDYQFDKGLIGGLRLQLGSFMIDTSIKNKLKKFELAMLEN